MESQSLRQEIKNLQFVKKWIRSLSEKVGEKNENLIEVLSSEMLIQLQNLLNGCIGMLQDTKQALESMKKMQRVQKEERKFCEQISQIVFFYDYTKYDYQKLDGFYQSKNKKSFWKICKDTIMKITENKSELQEKNKTLKERIRLVEVDLNQQNINNRRKLNERDNKIYELKDRIRQDNQQIQQMSIKLKDCYLVNDIQENTILDKQEQLYEKDMRILMLESQKKENRMKIEEQFETIKQFGKLIGEKDKVIVKNCSVINQLTKKVKQFELKDDQEGRFKNKIFQKQKALQTKLIDFEYRETRLKKNIQKLNIKIERQMEINQSNNKIIAELRKQKEDQCKQKENQIAELSRKVQAGLNQISKKELEIAELHKKLQCISNQKDHQISQLQKSLLAELNLSRQQDQQISELQKKIQNQCHDKQGKQKEQQIVELKKSVYIQKESKIAQLQCKVEALQKLHHKTEAQLNLAIQKDRQSSQLKKMEDGHMVTKINEKENQIAEMKKEIKDKCMQKDNQIAELQKNILEKQNIIIGKDRKVTQLKKSTQQQLKEKDNHIAELNKKLEDKSQENAKHTKQLIDSYEQQLLQKQNQIIELTKRFQDHIVPNHKPLYLQDKLQLFVGQCIQSDSDRLYIVQQLQKLHSTPIAKTKLLFSYPAMKQVNPHSVLDGQHNYIILMRIDNNTKFKQHIIALYSERPLSKQAGLNNGKGFISSVTNKKTFFLNQKSSSRVAEYNEYYFIFGNSQLRFKFNSNQLETNIGHNFRSFDTGDLKSAEVFTGSTEAVVSFDNYEVFQIIFGGGRK